jgi:hypothetical protein
MKREIRLCSPLVLWRYGVSVMLVHAGIMGAMLAISSHLFPGLNIAYFAVPYFAFFFGLLYLPARLSVREHLLEVRWLGFRKSIAFSDVTGVERTSGFHYGAIDIALKDGKRFILPVESDATGFPQGVWPERDDVMMLVRQHWQDSLLQGEGPYRARLSHDDELKTNWQGQTAIGSIKIPSLFHQRPAVALVALMLFMFLGVMVGGLVSEQWRALGAMLFGALGALFFLVPARLELYDAHLGLRWLVWKRYIPLHAVVEIQRMRKFASYEGIALKFNARDRMIVHVAKGMFPTSPKVKGFLDRLDQQWEVARQDATSKAADAQRAREK